MFSVNIDSLLQDSAPNDPTFSLSNQKGGRLPFYMTKMTLSRAGLEPAPMGSKERPSELPFIQIATFKKASYKG